jgi:hypothetical protein
MNITISKKKISTLLLPLVILILIMAGGYAAWKNNLLERLLPKQKILGTEPELASVSAFYAPNLENGYQPWLDQVCAGMSGDGCNLLRNLYGRVVWEAVKKSGASFIQSQALILEDVETLSNEHHIWKLGVTVLSSDPRGVQATNQLQPYAQVSFNQQSETWLLERILFDQEVKERYGVEMGAGQ